MNIPVDYPALLRACRDTGVSRFRSGGDGFEVEFFGGANERMPTPVGAIEVRAPRPDASVEELEKSAPEHPLDAILNQPTFAVHAPEESDEMPAE